MTDQTTALALLRDAENYLSALHGSVARHDHLAANLGCAGCDLRDRIAAELRRVADETAATETPDEAWQREWDRRPDGADVSDLFEIVAVVPCSGTLFSAHQPHTWEPQPGVPAVHCPGERQPAAGARQDGAQR